MIERVLQCLISLLLVVTLGAFFLRVAMFSALVAILIVLSLLLIFTLGVYLGRTDIFSRKSRTMSAKLHDAPQ